MSNLQIIFTSSFRSGNDNAFERHSFKHALQPTTQLSGLATTVVNSPIIKTLLSQNSIQTPQEQHKSLLIVGCQGIPLFIICLNPDPAILNRYYSLLS